MWTHNQNDKNMKIHLKSSLDERGLSLKPSTLCFNTNAETLSSKCRLPVFCQHTIMWLPPSGYVGFCLNHLTFSSQMLCASSKISVTLVVADTNLQRFPPLFLSWVGALHSPLQTQLCCVKSVMKKQTRHLLDNFTDCCHDLPSAAVDCEMVLTTLLVAWFCVFDAARIASVIGLMRAGLQPCCCFNKTAIAFSLCLLSLSDHLSLCSYLPFCFFGACWLAGCCMTHGTLIQWERYFFFSRTRTLIVSIIKPGRDT